MVYPTRIYLTGFMGSGKSTVGPPLAEHLGYQYIDLDQAVEKATGSSIRQIFSDRGEEEFRSLESLTLRTVSRAARVVISLGGGAVTSEDNLYFVETNGTLVYLKVPPAELVRRIRKMGDLRPLLLDGEGRPLSEHDLERRVEEMIDERQRYYSHADIVIDVGDRGVKETVDATVEALADRILRDRSRT